MYNPFESWPVTGSWADHLSYSLGGIDYPLDYNTPLPAPAAGTLRTSGGSGEYQAGQVGSAGRRSILILDEPVLTLYAIVFQHQASFGAAKHYGERETVGLSGASANGDDWGGQVHVHTHGLTQNGTRIDWRAFIPYANAAQAATAATKLTPIEEEEDMIYPWVFITEDARIGGVWWKYDGRAKYMCAPGDPQLLVDLGLAAKVEVKVLGPRINSIPTGTV